MDDDPIEEVGTPELVATESQLESMRLEPSHTNGEETSPTLPAGAEMARKLAARKDAESSLSTDRGGTKKSQKQKDAEAEQSKRQKIADRVDELSRQLAADRARR